jgi:pimeloyl-ACP methyl ester carboxylesterase
MSTTRKERIMLRISGGLAVLLAALVTIPVMAARDAAAGEAMAVDALTVDALTVDARTALAIRLRKGYVDGPWGQLHYYEAGDADAPVLILAHQSPVSARMFERAMSHLAAAGLRAVAVDTPGYGNSDPPPGPPTIEEYAPSYAALLDGLGLEHAHFLGHHTGAGILCHFAVKHPRRVRSLVLNGPPLFSAEKRAALQKEPLGAPPIYRDGSHQQIRWDRRARYTPGWTDAAAMHRRLVDQLWAGPTVWYGHHAAFRYDMELDLMALRGPVLILTNTGDDIYETALRVHRMRPDFDFVELAGGTHDIVDEQPAAWARAVADFVLGVEADSGGR